MRDYWNDPPDEPSESPIIEEVEGYLPESMPDNDRQDLLELVRGLIAQTEKECPACAKRANDAEAEADRLAKEWHSQPLPQSELCIHGKDFLDCNACAIADDLAYDAARERRYR